ncbi:hypothetical protein SLEP1_g35858 [Rubroshorea leprosula]|nr:hypothetical protein SLEP1_g35858 [Rubroshorea leprosula]
MDIVPLMAANAGNSGRAAISSLNSPPFIAVELCREHMGVKSYGRYHCNRICYYRDC